MMKKQANRRDSRFEDAEIISQAEPEKEQKQPNSKKNRKVFNKQWKSND